MNSTSDDVEYSYDSWLPQVAADRRYAETPTINPALGGTGVADYHFHPAQGRVARLTLVLPL